MLGEETSGLEVVEYPWYEGPAGALRDLIGDSPLGTDFPAEHGREVGEEISPLRYVLDPDAIERYRRVGAEAADAVSEAAASVRPRLIAGSRFGAGDSSISF